jgi:hypothetical protein
VSAQPFDFVAALDIITGSTDAELAILTEDNPRLKSLADNLAQNVASAPEFTPEQRAGIRAVFRGAAISGRAAATRRADGDTGV